MAGLVGYMAYGPKGGSADQKTSSAEKAPQPKKPEMGPSVVSKLRPTPIQPAQLRGEQTERMMQLQDYWKSIAEDALSRFEVADPRVGQIHTFMKNNAFYSIPMGPVVTQQVFKGSPEEYMKDTRRNANAFEVVFMPEKYASRMRSSILTESGGRTVRIATSFKSREWLGIMLAHELSHVEDQIVHGENSRNKDEYMAGEIKAHKFEMNLLKSWNPEVYATLIEKGAPFYAAKKIDELDRLIASLYPVSTPEVSQSERNLGLASAIIAIAFETAIKKGATDKDLEIVYQGIVKEFSGM